MQLMGDLVFVAITVAFFALAAAYVRACARIIGPDTSVDTELVERDRGEDENALVSR
jgi:hypothetical protein